MVSVIVTTTAYRLLFARTRQDSGGIRSLQRNRRVLCRSRRCWSGYLFRCALGLPQVNFGFHANGTLVGAVAVVLAGGLIFVAKPENRLMYAVSSSSSESWEATSAA